MQGHAALGFDASSACVRPSIPGALVVALPCWAACAATFEAAFELSRNACFALFLATALGALAVSLVAARRHTGVRLCAVGLLCGCALALSAATGLHAVKQGVESGQVGISGAWAIEDARQGSFGSSCMAIAITDAGFPVMVRLSLGDGGSVLCWEHLDVRSTLASASKQGARTLWRKGCVATAKVADGAAIGAWGPLGFLSSFRRMALQCFDAVGAESAASDIAQGALLMKSLSFGERSGLFADECYYDLKSAGLAHIAAVSGAHLAIVSAAVAACLARLRIARRWRIAVQVGCIAVFVLCAGAPISAVRAAFMCACAFLSFFARRRAHSVNALALCILVLVATWPPCAVSASFALSATATLAIALFARYFSGWFGVLFAHRLPAVCDVLGMTLAAWLATLPFAAALFSVVPLASPLANLIATPMLALLCVGGIVAGGASLAFPALGAFMAVRLCALAQLLLAAARSISHFPYTSIPASADLAGGIVVCLAAFAILYVWWPRPSRAGALAVGCAGMLVVLGLFLVAPRMHGAEIIMSDVGQGDAIIVRDGPRAILIDTGNQDAKVLAALARHGVYELDMLVISHPDDDHCASLPAVARSVNVGRIGVARDLASCSCESCSGLRRSAGSSSLELLEPGNAIRWGRFEAQVLAPRTFAEEGGNEDSLVMQIEFDADGDGDCDASMLTSGDAESSILEGLASKGMLAPVDIYKVAHHGSRDSTSERLLDAIRPSVALVSCGKDNRYGHPSPSTLENLEAWDVQVYRTDELGDVVCSLSAQGIAVHAQRGLVVE